jgi:hypothetical protein
MGDPKAQKPPYELTVGTDYYQETIFHLALQGAQGALYRIPIFLQQKISITTDIQLE